MHTTHLGLPPWTSLPQFLISYPPNLVLHWSPFWKPPQSRLPPPYHRRLKDLVHERFHRLVPVRGQECGEIKDIKCEFRRYLPSEAWSPKLITSDFSEDLTQTDNNLMLHHAQTPNPPSTLTSPPSAARKSTSSKKPLPEFKHKAMRVDFGGKHQLTFFSPSASLPSQMSSSPTFQHPPPHRRSSAATPKSPDIIGLDGTRCDSTSDPVATSVFFSTFVFTFFAIINNGHRHHNNGNHSAAVVRTSDERG